MLTINNAVLGQMQSSSIDAASSSGSSMDLTNALYGGRAVASLGDTFSKYVSYRAQAAYQRSIGRINEMLAKYSYEQALDQGAKAVGQHRAKVNQLIGSQRTSYAAQGVDLTYGSAVQTMQDTRFLGEMDALTLKNNAYKEAFGYKLSAIDASTQARLLSVASRAQGASTLLTGGIETANYGLLAKYQGR